jgi:hypothetical protein
MSSKDFGIKESISNFLSTHNKRRYQLKTTELHHRAGIQREIVPLRRKNLQPRCFLKAFDGDQDKLDAFNRTVYSDQRKVQESDFGRDLRQKPMLLQLS